MFLGFFSKSSRKHLNITPYFMDFSWSKNLLTKFEGHSLFQTKSICKNKKKRNFHHFINNSAQNATETLYPSEWRRRSYSLTFEGIFLLVCKKLNWPSLSKQPPHVKTITFDSNVLCAKRIVTTTRTPFWILFESIQFECFCARNKVSPLLERHFEYYSKVRFEFFAVITDPRWWPTGICHTLTPAC